MIVLALVAMTCAIVAAVLPAGPVPHTRNSRPNRRLPWWVPPIACAAATATGGLAAVSVDAPVTGAPLVTAVVLVVLAAITGGAVMVPAVFSLTRRAPEVDPGAGRDDANGSDLLRGGLMIGALERIAVVVSIVAGWPEGIAIVLAVKGLARYPELRDAHTSEYFIIGTFTSVLWALATGGVGAALLL